MADAFYKACPPQYKIHIPYGPVVKSSDIKYTAAVAKEYDDNLKIECDGYSLIKAIKRGYIREADLQLYEQITPESLYFIAAKVVDTNSIKIAHMDNLSKLRQESNIRIPWTGGTQPTTHDL